MNQFKFFSFVLLAASLFAFTNPTKNCTANQALSFNVLNDVLTFKTETIDIGSIPQGKPIDIDFAYSNNSGKTVIISNVTAACGCTVGSYSKEPIAEGKSGKVTATFNAAAVGPFVKTITVYIDGEQTPKTLTFKGEVK